MHSQVMLPIDGEFPAFAMAGSQPRPSNEGKPDSSDAKPSFRGLHRQRLHQLILLLLLPLLCYASGPSSPSPDRAPIQAELVKSIEAGRVRVGDAIYAKVELAWNNSACKLREGAILKGRVVAQTPRVKGEKSELALLFESGQCNGPDMRPLPLTVAAVLAPDPNRGSSLYGNDQSVPLSDAVGLSLGGGGGSPMRSMTAAAATVILEPPVNKPPVVVMPGQVIGLGSMKLAVGGGPEGSSVLSSEKHNLRLDTGSRFVLVATITSTSTSTPPVSADSSNSAANPGASSAAVFPDLDAINDADTCVPPACNVALETSSSETTTTAAAFTMPIQQLGFATALDREMYDLDHADTISYLGSKKLLLTFHAHVLVPRTGKENTLPQLHIVRAALIDLTTLKVAHTVDWRVHDAQQYLWPIGRDAILVHAGSELRMYTSDLKLEHRMGLNGPLAFVSVAPSGKYFAAGIIRERHPENIHRELVEAENREPEEDVEVKVLDSDFRTLVSVMRSSRDVPPVLTDDGEIRIPTIGKNRWRIAEYSWTGQRRILKQVDSTCRPKAVSVPPNLLFVTGCDSLADGKWYRMFRSDGKLVLKGQSSSSEHAHTASGTHGSGLFAVGITELTKPMDDESAFHSSDLKSLHVRVYRGEDGKKIAGITLPNPLPTVQTFALSPDGHQLAVLANTQIVFYALPFASEHQ
jgi:hypothetical protein